MRKLICAVVVLFAVSPLCGQKNTKSFVIDDDFPGGNIVVDSIAGNTVFLHQDLKDTKGNWFYWNFRVKGAAKRTVTFRFTHPWGDKVSPSNVIGVKGPGISLDGGWTWDWLGVEHVEENSFTYKFGADQNDVRFSFGMPYTSAQLVDFLKPYQGHPYFYQGTLAMTRSGRDVERLHLGQLHKTAKHKMVLTARHHACEMMTNYVLEGLIKFILEDGREGKWLRENVEFLIIPFVDKDGVEQGDQGKNRNGRDHNRDYAGGSIYASTAALRNYIPVWSEGKLVAGIDLHCPWIRGKDHEIIHQVGSGVESVWKEQQRLSALLEQSTAQSALPYYAASDMPYGTSWNTDRNYTAGMSFSRWVATVPGVKLGTTIEVPYANASGKTVTQNTARVFGKDLGKSIYEYLVRMEVK